MPLWNDEPSPGALRHTRLIDALARGLVPARRLRSPLRRMLGWLLVLSVRDLADAENSYTGQAWLGVGPPLVIGVGVMLTGVALMLWWRRRDTAFWRERPSVLSG